MINQACDDDLENVPVPRRTSKIDPKEIEIILRRNSLTPDLMGQEKTRVLMSIVCICIGNSLASSGRMSLMNSITSLIEDENLARTSLSISSVCQFITAIIGLLLKAKKKLISIKWMVIIACVLGSVQTVAFFQPTWSILIPSSIALGLGKSLFISSGFAYCSTIGYWYHHLMGGNLNTILVLMNGLVHASANSGFLWGNLIIYMILDPGSLSDSVNTIMPVCGVNYCNEDISNITTMQLPPRSNFNILITVFTVMAIVGVFVVTLIGDFSDKLPSVQGDIPPIYLQALKETWNFVTNRKILLLSIPTIFIGLMHSFIIGEFTKAYISCSLGIPQVGSIMAGYGATLIIAGCIQWFLVKFFGRLVVVTAAYAMYLSSFLMLLIWPESEYSFRVFIVVVVLYGTGESFLMGVLAVLYATLHERHMTIGLTLLSFWRTWGLSIAFGYAPNLCTKIQLYILITVGTLALISYMVLEIILLKNAKSYELEEIEENGKNLSMTISTDKLKTGVNQNQDSKTMNTSLKIKLCHHFKCIH